MLEVARDGIIRNTPPAAEPAGELGRAVRVAGAGECDGGESDNLGCAVQKIAHNHRHGRRNEPVIQR